MSRLYIICLGVIKEYDSLSFPTTTRLSPPPLLLTRLEVFVPQFECLDTLFFSILLYVRPSVLGIDLAHSLRYESIPSTRNIQKKV
jgi:hypothetical protein